MSYKYELTENEKLEYDNLVNSIPNRTLVVDHISELLKLIHKASYKRVRLNIIAEVELYTKEIRKMVSKFYNDSII